MPDERAEKQTRERVSAAAAAALRSLAIKKLLPRSPASAPSVMLLSSSSCESVIGRSDAGNC